MAQRQPPASKPPRIGLGWWVLAFLLLLWNLLTLLPKGQPQVTLPYTSFLEQVQSGNIATVRVNGSQITGRFIHPVQWPPPAGGTTPASKSAAAAPPAAAPYGTFLTYFPQALGDASLVPLLKAHKVELTVAPPPNPVLDLFLTTALPALLFLGVLVFIGRQAARGQGGALNFGRIKPREYTAEQTRVTFADVAGEDEAKAELVEVVDFLRHPQKYHDLGARIPRGVLLVGPPGTGKTLMARAVAGEAGAPFLSLSASEFVQMFVGVGASRVRDLFAQAKKVAPAIVFIDELDAVGRRRGAGVGTVNDEREQTLNQFLVEMDGFDERHEIIVLAATNRPDVLDPALLRPGRFDRQVAMGLPDRRGRKEILHLHTRHLPLAKEVDLEALAGSTPGFSGADLANLCNEAALAAAHHARREVTPADFEEALDKVVLGGVRSVLLSPQDRRVVAYHESGHALVAWLLPAADPVRRVTIIPHGRALGVTQQLPGADRYNYSREYLLARLAVMLGGRAAEELAIGDITTGAENDLIEATGLARRMVTRWGMGSLGPLAFHADEQQPFLGYSLAQGRDYSEDTAARIDRDIRSIVEERQGEARRTLSGARGKLDQLVQALLKEETIDEEALARILGPRPDTVPPPDEIAGTQPVREAAGLSVTDTPIR
jgi:cell division protease FtsH